MNEIITSTENKIIKEARSLNDKKHRKLLGKFLVDGEKLVREVVFGGLKVDKLFIDSARMVDFSYILEKFSGKVVETNAKVITSISENVTPQGIIAEVFIPESKSLESFKNEPILVLDRIQDPGNLGTIIRTAVATGFNNIVLIDTVDPFSPKVVRSSSGGVAHINFFKLSESEVIDYAKNQGIELLVADMGGDNIFKTQTEKFGTNFALVIGNEGQGISDNFKQKGRAISLPMKDKMESLNAGISASVLMYALLGKNI